MDGDEAEAARPETERKAAMHRVRVGAIGLACVFLLVMLATALLRAAGDGALDNANSALVANAADAPSEPLAELGVAPGNVPPEGQAKPATQPAAPAPATAAPAPSAVATPAH